MIRGNLPSGAGSRLFLNVQRQDMCANRVLDFVQSFLTPARFVGRREVFEQRRSELNTILAFSGLEIGADGKFRQREAARTLDEAERRFQKIRGKFQGRRLHSEVLKYCRTELMQDNYFHAVFEATKGFAALLKGCFGAVRNPLAHEPKILWEGEDDAADYLSLISLLHRKLDDCVSTRMGNSQ